MGGAQRGSTPENGKKCLLFADSSPLSQADMGLTGQPKVLSQRLSINSESRLYLQPKPMQEMPATDRKRFLFTAYGVPLSGTAPMPVFSAPAPEEALASLCCATIIRTV